ncbi:unnamed protein product [Albugo candida]|uniref:Uncharacterized protein n=1 Tax=Albugo candida TaxID=65357 RepID=A0A024GUV8_9STRA|nr:unnamed protein product [Albugo candida]|eukprot:CCI50776.1 unnamed protein product [Albugo candida]
MVWCQRPPLECTQSHLTPVCRLDLHMPYITDSAEVTLTESHESSHACLMTPCSAKKTTKIDIAEVREKSINARHESTYLEYEQDHSAKSAHAYLSSQRNLSKWENQDGTSNFSSPVNVKFDQHSLNF